MKRVLCILLMMLIPSVAFASANADQPQKPAPAWLASHHEEPEPPTPPAASSRLRSILAVFVVLSLIGFAVWSKAKKRSIVKKNPTAYVKISDSVKVGEKAHLVVATVGRRTMVLGVTEHGIRRIFDVPPEDAPVIADAPATTTKIHGAFHNKLASLLGDVRGDKDSRDARENKNYALLALDDSATSAANATKKPSKQDESDDEREDEITPPAVSAPLLRVANDAREHHAPRFDLTDSMGVEEQVSGLLAARARRS